MSWPQVPLSEVADIVRGVSFDRSEIHNSPTERYIPILRAGNIQDSLNIEDDLVWVPAYRVSESQIMQEGDIAIAMSSGSILVVGKTARLAQEWRGSVGAFCAIIRPNSAIDSSFLDYYLKGQEFVAWRKNRGIGLNIKNLRRSELAAFPVPLPPLPEQRRIVEILDQAYWLRKLWRDGEETATQMLPSLFYNYFGDPLTNSKNWEMKSLGSVSLMGPQYGANASAISWDPSRPRYIRITDLDDHGGLRNDDIKSLDADNWQDFILSEGDILFARSGATVGKAVMHRELDYPCVFAGYLIRFRVDRDIIDPWLIFGLTRTAYYRDWVSSKKRTAAQPNINGQEYASLLIPVPPKEIQAKYVLAAKKMMAIQKQRASSDETIEHLCAILNYRAFTGELTKEWREELLK